MLIPDNVIRNKIKNVYFIWGRGKTTIANKLHEKYGYYVYSTDNSRSRHFAAAEPEFQPYMCHNYEKEYGVILCEGDIDYEAVLKVASHSVYLRNCGTKFDWFDRPDHIDSINEIRSRTDLTDNEKEQIIANAYSAVTSDEGAVPEWVIKNKVKEIVWNDHITIEQTVSDVEQYFKFGGI